MVSLGHDFTGFGYREEKGLCLFLSHIPFWSLNTNHSQQKRGVLEGGRRLLVTGMCSLTISSRIVARQKRPGGSM